MSVCKFLHVCYANITAACLSCSCYISTCFIYLKHSATVTHNLLVESADYSLSFAVSCVTTFFVIVTTLGSFCVNFVTGVWQGLGFVLSSVASFPMYCVESLKNTWMRGLECLANVATATTKETYLGVVVLCLMYLTLSNTLRYLYCKGLSLFPRRMRGRRGRINRAHWQFDRGFESDFEDLYGSDTDDTSWINPRHDDDARVDEPNDHNANNLENISDADDGSESEEYTVVTEESDTDASIDSQTFSTESSDHEIEVQLPSVSENSSGRSLTPSHVPKPVSNLEDFDREMERERDKRKCVICQDHIKSVLLLPCKHMCMCVRCADHIVRSRTIGQRVCPLCRARIAKVMNIYV